MSAPSSACTFLAKVPSESAPSCLSTHGIKMVKWSNSSVVAFSGCDDPVTKIQDKARELALTALESGWSGPPYSPIKIAEMLGAKVVPNYDIADARTIAVDD